MAAYTDASGRGWTGTADTNLNVKAGTITGETFKPGVYQWGSDVTFTDNIYIKGNRFSRYIFQSTGNVIAGSGANVILQEDGSGFGRPDPANIVWVMAGYLDAGTTSHLEGVFLVKTPSMLKTGSSLNGRILSQTACTLDQVTIVGTAKALSGTAVEDDVPIEPIQDTVEDIGGNKPRLSEIERPGGDPPVDIGNKPPRRPRPPIVITPPEEPVRNPAF